MNHRIRVAVTIGRRDTPKISVIADIPTESVVYQNTEHERGPTLHGLYQDFYEGIITSA
jgi:hypothetical protein